MRCLFVTAREATDHLASCLWDGLQEVLGPENVFDAVGHRLLHAFTCGESIYQEGAKYPFQSQEDMARFGEKDVLSSISGRRQGQHWRAEDGLAFDLLVLNAAFLREWDWSWAKQWTAFLRASADIVYVEGWDSPHQVHPPEIHVDAIFRKEIDPNYRYPYDCHHLTFAAPARWFHPDDEASHRPRDVFYSGTTHSNPLRWTIMRGVFQSQQVHQSVISTAHLGCAVPEYFNHYRRSKIALCPSSAERADSLRTYEAVACGAIPLFVDYPERRREDWFTGEHCFQCSADRVAEHVDIALDKYRDLQPMRSKLLAHARAHHTTRARAEKLLRVLGISHG